MKDAELRLPFIKFSTFTFEQKVKVCTEAAV